MAGFWQGIAKAVGEKDQQMHETRERDSQQQFTTSRDEQHREFEREQARTQFENQFTLKRFEIASQYAQSRVGPRGTPRASSSGSTTAADNPQHSVDVLVNRYGVPDELIERVAMDGNPASLGKAVELLDSVQADYREKWGTDLPPEIVVQMFETAVVTQSQTGTIDWDAAKSDLGFEVPEEVRGMFPAEFEIMGETSFEEPVIKRQYKPEEIKQARDLVREQATVLADDAKYTLNNTLAKFAELETSGVPLSPEQNAVKQNALAMQMELQAALEASSKGNIKPLLKMFAPDAARHLQEYYPDLADAPLGFDFK